MRNRKKMWLALAFFVAALMLFRFAWAIIDDDFSVVMVICGAALFLAALIFFAIYFKE